MKTALRGGFFMTYKRLITGKYQKQANGLDLKILFEAPSIHGMFKWLPTSVKCKANKLSKPFRSESGCQRQPDYRSG